MRLTFLIIFSWTLTHSYYGLAQDSIPLLLLDKQIRIEATEGINDMYNFEFGRADGRFKWLKRKYDWHPLPYFLLGLSQWWRIVPEINDTAHDERFFYFMDSSLLLSKQIFDRGSKVEGAFFIAATYAFIGRLHAERRHWRKAASAGKNSMRYLEYCRGKEEFGAEILFGDAVYNYYSEWIPENYPLLRPVMAFFKSGDKEEGLRQLKEVANNAFFTRTEAQYFLMRILANEEKKPKEALFTSQYLRETFPNNPYFHRFYAQLLYSTGNLQKAEKESLSIIDRLENKQRGYEYTSGRYGAFFLGEIYSRRKKTDLASKYYNLSIEYGDKVDAQKKGFYLYSVLNLGIIAHKKGDKKAAKAYYKRVLKLSKSKHNASKSAKEYLEKLRKGKPPRP